MAIIPTTVLSGGVRAYPAIRGLRKNLPLAAPSYKVFAPVSVLKNNPVNRLVGWNAQLPDGSLVSPYTLTGTVQAAPNMQIGDVILCAWQIIGGQPFFERYWTTLPAEDGSFSFTGLPPQGKYFVGWFPPETFSPGVHGPYMA